MNGSFNQLVGFNIATKEMEMRSKGYRVRELIDVIEKGLDGKSPLPFEYHWISNHRQEKFSYLFQDVSDKLYGSAEKLKIQFERLAREESTDSYDLDSGRDFGLYRDVFFFYGASILDIFARELSCFYSSYYGGRDVFPKDVYFNSFIEWLNGGNRKFEKELPEYLNKQKNNWIKDFLLYRHYIVHVGTFQNQSIQPDGDRIFHLLLPDNTKVRPDKYTFNKQVETVEFCSNFMDRVIDMMDFTFSFILNCYKE